MTTLLSLLSPGEHEALLAGLTEKDWQDIALAATLHQLDGILYDSIKNDQDLVPGLVLKSLHKKQLKMGMQNIYLYEQLDRILGMLGEQGIEVILLKGAYLAREVYSHLGLRCMSDVDVLVRREDLDKVERLLFSLGYTPDNCHRVITDRNHHFAYRKKGAITLEVHWALHWSCLKTLDTDELWRRSVRVEADHQRVYALSPEDLVLHLCLHTALHIQNIRLRMIYDLKAVLKTFSGNIDLIVICERARAWKVHGSVYVFMRLLKELLGEKIKDEWLRELKPDHFMEQYFLTLKEKVLEFEGDNYSSVMGSHSMLLWSSKGRGYKLKLLMEYLLVSPRVISLKYPASASSMKVFLYYPAYWMDLVKKTIRLLRQGYHKKDKPSKHVNQINELTLLRHWMLCCDDEGFEHEQ